MSLPPLPQPTAQIEDGDGRPDRVFYQWLVEADRTLRGVLTSVTGAITSIIAGTGLTGGGTTGAVTLSLANTTVTPGSYGGSGKHIAVTVDQQGRITAASESTDSGSVTPAALTSVSDTNVTATLGGTPTTALLQGVSLTLGWTGTLAAARLNANVVQGITNDTNLTGTISAQALTLGWTGQLSIARGGTGQSTATAAFDALSPNTTLGDLSYRGSSNNVRLAGNTTSTKKFLRQTGTGSVSAAPAWDTVTASDVGLGSVTNDAQTKAAVVPNTVPSAGQVLAGNAGATAYAPVSVSGDAGLSSAGVLTLASTGIAAATYGTASQSLTVTADIKGRILGIAANAISITPTQAGLGNVTNNAQIIRVKEQVFTASGTYTPSAGMVYCIIECAGGGGGGGNATGSLGNIYSGGGGGSGSYSRTISSAASVGASKVVTIGAGGSAGSAGGDTSVGTLCVGKGGGAGATGSAASVPTAGAGGVAGTGDVTTVGAGGGPGFYNGANTSITIPSGFGGSSYFGGGAAGVSSNLAGSAGGRFGGGGSGGHANNTTSTFSGGAGGAGVVVITEYCTQ